MATLLPSVAKTALLLALALAQLDLSACHLLKGSVTCTDCAAGHDLSGVQVAVDCMNEKRMTALTNKKGYFDVDIPTWLPYTAVSPKSCLATLLGGPEQLYAFKKSMVSKIVNSRALGSCTLSTPLTFLTSLPPNVEHPKYLDMGSSKAEGPLFPGGYFAFAPAFFRFIPIIGIP